MVANLHRMLYLYAYNIYVILKQITYFTTFRNVFTLIKRINSTDNRLVSHTTLINKEILPDDLSNNNIPMH